MDDCAVNAELSKCDFGTIYSEADMIAIRVIYRIVIREGQYELVVNYEKTSIADDAGLDMIFFSAFGNETG